MRRPAARAGPPAAVAWLLATAPLLGPADLAAQTLQGRALDIETSRPLVSTLVQLVDVDGTVQATALTGDSGGYRLDAPGPGEYEILAERLGYEEYRSARVELPRAEAAYQVDLLLTPTPIPLRGIEVTAERRERLERSMRLETGLSPASLRYPLVLRDEIESHLDRGHELADLVRWQNLPSLWLRREVGGTTCFLYRGRSCLPVYLNGFPLQPYAASAIPLDLVETIAILTPGETMAYPGGGVMLYTAGWLQSGG